MPPAAPFQLFGSAHLTTLLVILAVAIALSLTARYALSSAWQYRVGASIGVLLMVQEGFGAWLHASYYGRAWIELLPLHLCGFAVFLTAWVMLTRSRLAYEIVYFWACGGTVQALLTPDLAVGFPSPAYLVFFIAHGLVVVGVLYATVVYRYRPRLESILKSVATLIGLALIVGPINLWLGTNYMFLSAKPAGASMMDYLGPWPWYILSLVVVGLLSCFVYYLPFFIHDLAVSRTGSRGRE